MSRMKRTSLKIMCTLGAVLGLAGCGHLSSHVVWEADGTPQHVPHNEQAWWRYQFVYHPESQVYFNPYTHVYYWYTGHEWVEGQRLPAHFTLDKKLAQVVRVHSKPPHVQHRTITTAAAGPSYGVFPSSANELGGQFAITTAEPEYEH